VPESGTVPEIWRYSETKPIAEMLASWKQKLRSLEWTVDPFNEEGGMMLRYDRATDVRPSVAFAFAMQFADLSVTRCRKFVRFIVIMAGLMTFGAMNVVRSCESGTGLSMSDWPSLVIACTRLPVSLLVRMTHRTMLVSDQARTGMAMNKLHSRISHLCGSRIISALTAMYGRWINVHIELGLQCVLSGAEQHQPGRILTTTIGYVSELTSS